MSYEKAKESRKVFVECFIKYSECIKKEIEKSFLECLKDRKYHFPDEVLFY
jgi:hypothetical protein